MEKAKETLISIIYSLAIIGLAIFTYFLPELWWDIKWQTLITIINKSDPSTNTAAEISKVTQALGITENNLHSWAFERIMIVLAISISLFIIFTITHNILYKKNGKKLK